MKMMMTKRNNYHKLQRVAGKIVQGQIQDHQEVQPGLDQDQSLDLGPGQNQSQDRAPEVVQDRVAPEGVDQALQGVQGQNLVQDQEVGRVRHLVREVREVGVGVLRVNQAGPVAVGPKVRAQVRIKNIFFSNFNSLYFCTFWNH